MAENTKTASKLSLPSDVEIVGSRIMDAPPELVFKAYTDPELIPEWWGPRRYTTTVDKMDVRPGGAWRFIHRAADGGQHAFNGVYREVLPPKRLVFTFNRTNFGRLRQLISTLNTLPSAPPLELTNSLQ